MGTSQKCNFQASALSFKPFLASACDPLFHPCCSVWPLIAATQPAAPQKTLHNFWEVATLENFTFGKLPLEKSPFEIFRCKNTYHLYKISQTTKKCSQSLKPEDFSHIHTKDPLTIDPWRSSQPNSKEPNCVKTYLSKLFFLSAAL